MNAVPPPVTATDIAVFDLRRLARRRLVSAMATTAEAARSATETDRPTDSNTRLLVQAALDLREALLLVETLERVLHVDETHT